MLHAQRYSVETLIFRNPIGLLASQAKIELTVPLN